MPRRLPGLLAAALVALGLGGILGLAQPVLAAGGGRLVVEVVDLESGKSLPCRMRLWQAKGRPPRVKGVVAWGDHFALPDRVTLDLPKGNYAFEIERGPEYAVTSGHFSIEDFADDTKQIRLKRFVDMSADGWWSGDLDVRRAVEQIELLMAAEDLHLAMMPSGATGTKARGPAVAESGAVRFDGNRYYSTAAGFCTWPGTTLLCLGGAKRPAVLAAGVPFPPDLEETVKRFRGEPRAWIDLVRPTAWDLPTLVALGQVDSISLAGGWITRDRVSDDAEGRPRDRKLYPGLHGGPRWEQEVYFRLLDCGLRIPPSAGSGSGQSPNPPGYNRMYVHVDGAFDDAAWWRSFREGRVTITNGPLMRVEVDGRRPGHVFRADEGERVELEIGLTLSTREPISYMEIIKDGQVAESIRFADYQQSGKLPKVRFERSGWFLLRAVTDLPETYRFAMTGPYYVEIGSKRRVSREDAKFFLEWVYERARSLQRSIADPAERQAALAPHRAARDFWQRLLEEATAE